MTTRRVLTSNNSDVSWTWNQTWSQVPRVIAVDVDGNGIRFTFDDGQTYLIDGQQLAALVGPVLLGALANATGVDRDDDEVPF